MKLEEILSARIAGCKLSDVDNLSEQWSLIERSCYKAMTTN